MSRVEGEPATIQEHLVPRAEIHRGWIGRDADVAEVARAVAGRDVHASGKRHGKMGEIPAGVVADRLRPLPAALDTAEELPGEVFKSFSVSQ